MPYVNIKITDEDVDQEKINLLIKETTESLSKILDKSPATTFVVVDVVPVDYWGIGGLPVTQYRAQQAK